MDETFISKKKAQKFQNDQKRIKFFNLRLIIKFFNRSGASNISIKFRFG